VTPRGVVAAGAVTAAALTLFGMPVAAQGLRTLHVDDLSMHADRTVLPVGADFHLTIHARVRERVTALDELVVPEVGTMHLLGDERHVRHGPAGTDVDETLTLEPVDAGSFVVPGAYLDAIDARTGKPTRFTANGVRIVVGTASGGGGIRRIALVLLGLLIAAMGVLLARRTLANRTRRAALPAEPAATIEPPQTRPPRELVRDAFAAYRRAPSRSALAQLRGALFVAAGSAPGATVRDAAALTADAGLRAALRDADAATFAPADARRAAEEDLLETVATWLQ
jgi:hypothetical protein